MYSLGAIQIILMHSFLHLIMIDNCDETPDDFDEVTVIDSAIETVLIHSFLYLISL